MPSMQPIIGIWSKVSRETRFLGALNRTYNRCQRNRHGIGYVEALDRSWHVKTRQNIAAFAR